MNVLIPVESVFLQVFNIRLSTRALDEVFE